MSNAPTSNPPKKRGCLFYGCLTVTIVAILMAVMVAVGVYMVRRAYQNTVNQYSDTTATPFEAVKFSAADREALMARVQSFQTSLSQGRQGFDLVLTADDLNVLIQENPATQGKLFVKIENDRMKGRVSLPLNEIIPPEVRKQFSRLQGRYLNAEVGFRIALEGGGLDVRLEEIQVRGKPLEEVRFLGSVIKDMKKRNLADDIQKDPKARENISRFESLQVRDGKIIIKGRSPQ